MNLVRQMRYFLHRPRSFVGWLSRRRENQTFDGFDVRWGTDTARFVRLNTVDIVGRNDIYANSYQVLDSRLFWKALHRIEEPTTEFVFVDIGSGKGKLLLLASRLRFQKVIGIEFSPQLVEISKSNMAKWKPRCLVEIFCKDACEYEFPPSNLIVTLYNPFDAPVLRNVLRRLRRSLDSQPRKMYILYFGPKSDIVQESFPRVLGDCVFTLDEKIL
jgi:SAM-dependent methyltransferase